jgi:hypothetical protein
MICSGTPLPLPYFKKILLLHAAETQTCTKREESKLQAVETKFLRAIVGRTRR